MKFTRLLLLSALIVIGCQMKTNAQVMIMESILGNGTAGSLGDGAGATAAQTNTPYGTAIDAAGNLYLAEQGGNRIRKISSGIITTIAGTGTAGFSGDNGAATAAKISSPTGIAVDASANVYFVDNGNSVIRKITAGTGIITTIAGTAGTSAYGGDGGPATAADLYNPRCLTLDASGNIYFSDPGAAFGATSERIRKITYPAGTISTIAGKSGAAGFGGDGAAATLATLSGPRGVVVDASGNVYFADAGNNRVRRIDAVSGNITTVAGTGTAGFTADGIAATASELNAASGVNFDPSGNLIISDASNNRVRMVNSSGIISTIAGVGGGAGFSGDGGAATAAKINGPVGVSYVNANMYYIYDRSNNRIRVVYQNHTPVFAAGSHQSITICENSSAYSLNSALAVTDLDSNQTETWSTSLNAANGTLVAAATAAAWDNTVTPSGLSYTPNVGYSGIDSFIVKVTDGLATAYDTIVVTINPLPVVAAITGANVVCQSANISLGETTGGGGWGVTNTNASVAGGTVTGINPGIDTVTYAVTNACGTTTVTYSVTVNPSPLAGVITGLGPVCTGSSITLTDGASGGVWSALNGTATVVSGNVTGVSVGTNIISYTVTNSCGIAYATFPLNIITVLSPGTISGSSSVCVGSSVTLSETVGGGTWNGTTGDASVSGSTVTGVTGGSDLISYAVNNACGTTYATYPITVNPLPVSGTISGPVSVCIAGTITLTDAAGGGAWSSSSANATVLGGTVTGVTVGAATISYVVTNVCGTSVATYPISIISVPSAGTLSGSSSVCQGASITLTDPVAGGTWSAANGNATVAAGSVTGVAGGSDIITYTVTYSCGTAFTTFPVTINPLPSPAAISGSSNLCMGGSTITLTDASSGGVWSASNGNATIAGGVVTSVSPGLDTISYSLTNSCGTVAATLVVSVSAIVTPAVSFTGSAGFTTCPGNSVTYSANPTNGGLTPAYSWKVNGTAMGTGNTFTYTPANGDNILCSMTSSYACVSTPTVTHSVTVTVKPDLVPAVSVSAGVGGDTICVGTLTTFSASPVNGGSAPTYQWNVNGAFAGSGASFAYVPSNGDMVYCTLNSSYLCPVPASVLSNTLTITVNTTETPSVTISAAPGTFVCVGTHVIFTANTVYGGSSPFIRWTVNGVNAATGPSFGFIPASGDHIYCMLASSATCSTNDSVVSNTIIETTTTAVAPTISIAATTATVINVGGTVTFEASVSGTTTPGYQWFINGVAVPGATNSAFTMSASNLGISNVTCEGYSGGPCNAGAMSSGIKVSVAPLGVKSVNAGQELTLLPNPNNGAFTIEGNVASGDNELKIEVMNLLGQVVCRQTIPVNNGTVNAQVILNSDLSNGVYLLNAISGQEHTITRFTLNK